MNNYFPFHLPVGFGSSDGAHFHQLTWNTGGPFKPNMLFQDPDVRFHVERVGGTQLNLQTFSSLQAEELHKQQASKQAATFRPASGSRRKSR